MGIFRKMMRVIKRLLRRVLYGSKVDSATYINHLRFLGMRIGEGTTIYVPMRTSIDTTRPWLISIGDNVKVTEGVTILTHGFDWSVLKGVYGAILGSGGGVSIGNNVFIGMHSTILKGVHIGDNVIIGANSLVNKDIPDNVVAAGNPCKVIMTLGEYYEKRRAAQLDEAKELVRLYRERYGKDPDESALHEFFWLFEDGSRELPEIWKQMMRIGDNYEFSMVKLKGHKPLYNGLEDFLKHI